MSAVSITAPQFTTDFAEVRAAVELAAPLGFAGVFFFDHLTPLGDPHRPVLELATVLGAAAALTDARVGTLVMRVPMRGVLLSALVAATAKAVRGSDLVVGLGAGDSLSSAEASRFGMAVPSFDERLEALAEAARLTRSRGIETWIGGTHRRVLETAAELADGWNGWGLETASLRAVCDRLRGDRADLKLTWGGAVMIGRDDDDLASLVRARGGDEGVIAGTVDEIRAELAARIEAGADELIVSVLPNKRNRWELFADGVLARL